MINKSLVARTVKKLQQEVNHIKENGVVGSSKNDSSSEGGGPLNVRHLRQRPWK